VEEVAAEADVQAALTMLGTRPRRPERRVGYLGIDPALVRWSVTDYALRSVNVVVRPLAIVALREPPPDRVWSERRGWGMLKIAGEER
jgi:hypothetical protein